MLSTVHPVLSGDLLLQLDRLGHGDELVVVDGNYPAYSSGATVVELPGCDAPTAVAAIRTVIPLDLSEGPSALLMAGAEGAPEPVVHPALRGAAAAPEDRLVALERFAFYDRARNARLVVRTSEQRVYANVILRKGVIVTPPSTTFAPA
ncbi:transport protein RbsD/FucU [Herbiconiux moechotypicola]|uniref:RbsD/FucU domain-containing protein n=1 Tax=Herbiconiux moechotypicola TaxID=637393 RepID=A0ABN3DHN9_9MICO|nr:RbsD/FucU domain-containing protein [Herbiconiux moechotypicola]MCS5729640.1 transport protein RbsD/FucU [Herbiconiux moechotypicola]